MKITQYDIELSEDKLPYLVKEKEFTTKYFTCNSPDKIVNILNEKYKLDMKAEEKVYVLGTNCKMKTCNIFEISKGIHNSSFINPFGIYQRLLLSNSTSFVIIHNHPSGDTTPSKKDIDSSKKLKELAKLMNIDFLDSLIVSRYNGISNYVSLRELEYI